jgi:hypothetical protein
MRDLAPDNAARLRTGRGCARGAAANEIALLVAFGEKRSRTMRTVPEETA